MTDFDLSVRLILDVEGRLSNNLRTDPDGGLTNFGISQKQNPDVDVANLTRDGAITVYRTRYWTPVHGDVMKWPLNLIVFDCAVNQGVGTASRLLQESVGVAVDGVIGVETLAAIAKRDPWELTARFAAKRLISYTTDKEWTQDGEGWYYRVAKNMLAAGKEESS